MAGAKSDPVHTLATLAVSMRTVQIALTLLYVAEELGGWGPLAAAYTGAPLLVQLLVLVVGGFGEALNMGIYNTIGKDGVYYGVKLGKEIPWVHGFPFNVCGHPQYVGCTLFLWAISFPVLLVGPASLAIVPTGWTFCYLFSGIVESDGTKGAVPRGGAKKSK